MLLVLLSLLFWSLLEIQSQTVSSPYLSFKGNDLPNNSYVDISQIGEASDGVQCISELDYCCNNRTSRLIADWYFPNGTQLNFPGDPGHIYESRGTHRADLRRRGMATLPTGIYCCIIPFNISIPLERKMLYVGVYNDQEGIDNYYSLHK